MQSVSCTLCGKQQTKHLFKKGKFNIMQCTNCNLIYVNPRLTAKELAKLYNSNKISPKDYYLANEKEDIINFAKRLSTIERYVKKGSLLDVGCNVGTFMQVAKNKGWSVTGIDLNKSAVAYARKKGLDVIAKSIEAANIKKKFDLIVMNDVVEHLEAPGNMLNKAASLLKPQGILFIATPDSSSAIAKLSGKHWLHIKPDEHIYYFSKTTIKALLAKTGLRTIKILPLGRIRTADIILEKAKTYTDLPHKLTKALGLLPLVKNIKLNINLHDEMGIIARKKTILHRNL